MFVFMTSLAYEWNMLIFQGLLPYLIMVIDVNRSWKWFHNVHLYSNLCIGYISCKIFGFLYFYKVSYHILNSLQCLLLLEFPGKGIQSDPYQDAFEYSLSGIKQSILNLKYILAKFQKYGPFSKIFILYSNLEKITTKIHFSPNYSLIQSFGFYFYQIHQVSTFF